MTDTLARLTTALSDRYAIERELGAGGMATVYLAHDLKHDRKVAIKVLRPELAAVLGADRFIQEIKTTANLQHPNILALYDSGEADGFLYYVMPFIDGETLRDKLNRETQLGIDEAVKITTDVADALDYAHRHNVIHRDIKPENILLHDGRPTVADFGIALAVSAAAGGRMTETGLSLGTPLYMSPEQATAEKDLTNRSDIYSLGAVLYEMLTGEPPHTGNSAQQIIMKIVTDEARPVMELRKSVPPNVAASTAKALEKLPADRFATAAEFAGALTNPVFALPTAGAAAVTDALPSGPWKRLAAGVTAVAAILLLTILWGWLRPDPRPPKPVIRYTLALAEEEALHSASGGASLALSSDGSRMVYAGPSDEAVSQLWLRERDQLGARPLPGTDLGHQPFFSPDGQRVAFVTSDSKLKVVALGGEPPVLLVDSDLLRLGGSWGPDGYLYFVQRPNGGLAKIPSTGGMPEVVSVPDSSKGVLRHSWPHALPSGKGVIVTLQKVINRVDEEDDVGVVDMETGEARALVRGVWGRYAVTGHLVFLRLDGALMAAPFDQGRLELMGPAVQLFAGIGITFWPEVALSETGRLVYVGQRTTTTLSEAVWVDRDGTAETVDPNWIGQFESVALSPDGTRLAATLGSVTQTEVWIKQLDRRPASRLTFMDGLNRRPAWTRDGRSVTFISIRGGNRDLYAKRADGAGSADVVLDLAADVDEGFWSPDGDWLIFRTGTMDGERDIFALRSGPDSATVPVAADSRFDEIAPVLSPDGRWLAYVSNETGQDEVWVRPFPNVDAGRWQVSFRGGTEPLWAHSGRELFYKSQGSMKVVGVQTSPTFATLEVRELFSTRDYFNFAYHRSYDVSADDQRFVMIRTNAVGEPAIGDLIVVENFFEELKAKLGN
jgi:serine/threonine-protein kinase